ncbi:MAG: HD domain-containing protein [Patescibacteria group bacterium]
MSDQLYRHLTDKAMEFAAIKHQGQWRKHPTEKIPYIEHPAMVGLMLAQAGYDDEVVAAGILHDVVEDCGVTLEELADKFSPRVARLVDQVSEPSKVLTWDERKQAYREKLAGAEVEALAIADVDHLHNLKNLVAVYAVDHSAAKMFKASLEKKMEHERLCAEIFRKRLGGVLSNEFDEALSEAVFTD